MTCFKDLRKWNNDLLASLNSRYISRHSTNIAYFTFATVFFYFGLQKPLPISSPVYDPLSLLASRINAPTGLLVNFVGFYEMILGIMFLFRKIRIAFWVFLAHQLTTLMVLLVIPFYAFQPPWLVIEGVKVPWILDSFAAFTLKNLIFIGGFLLLAENELDGNL